METEAETGETSASSEEEDVTVPSLVESATPKQGQERLLLCHGVEGSGKENSRKLFRNRISYFGAMTFARLSRPKRNWIQAPMLHTSISNLSACSTWNDVLQFKNQCTQVLQLNKNSIFCTRSTTTLPPSEPHHQLHIHGTYGAAKLIVTQVVQICMIWAALVYHTSLSLNSCLLQPKCSTKCEFHNWYHITIALLKASRKNPGQNTREKKNKPRSI